MARNSSNTKGGKCTEKMNAIGTKDTGICMRQEVMEVGCELYTALFAMEANIAQKIRPRRGQSVLHEQRV